MNDPTESSTQSRSSGRRTSNIKQRLQQDSKEKIESGKRAAADQIAEIADAIDMAGAQLDQSQPTLANFASKLADGVGGLAARLREDSIEDIYRDVRQVASRHPGMFVLGSAALGLMLARFVRASGEQSLAAEQGTDSQDWQEDELSGDPREEADTFPHGTDASPPDPYGSASVGA